MIQMSKVKFKELFQNQTALFPIDFENLISATHPVRIINSIVDKLDITSIINSYKGGGTSSYHPRMLLKVLIYGYLNNIYSCRKIENALKENIHFIWLSGQNFPDFRTINYFRGNRLKNEIEDIFRQVVLLLMDSGVVSLKEVFTDGTKIESIANRYTFVWKKTVEKQKDKLEIKIQSILSEINSAIEEDNLEKEEVAPVSLTSEELNRRVQEINEKLKKKATSKSIKKKVAKLQNESLPKLAEYEKHLQIMGNRNSYSKTDTDATFMCLKEDQMKNRQLKPAYNLQLSTENNFITNFSLHQRPGDTATYIAHLESFNNKYGQYPQIAVADAGYGSLENYEYLDKNAIQPYVKYNYFHKEQGRNFKLDVSRVENLHYNENEDYFVCPIGQKMVPIGKTFRSSDIGYQFEVVKYQAHNCKNCSIRGACNKQEGNRIIEVNHKLRKYKQQVRKNLMSEQGIILRGRRCAEVEQTFGHLKWNKKFKRYLSRGLEKVTIETGLLAIAHNIQKLSILCLSNPLDVLNNHFFELCTKIMALHTNINLFWCNKRFFIYYQLKLEKAAYFSF
jgi:transposase